MSQAADERVVFATRMIANVLADIATSLDSLAATTERLVEATEAQAKWADSIDSQLELVVFHLGHRS